MVNFVSADLWCYKKNVVIGWTFHSFSSMSRGSLFIIYNRVWLEDGEYVQMVKELWNMDVGERVTSAWDLFHLKI